MNTNHTSQQPTNVRWTICAMLFVATAVNYMDRQALSLRWKDFIAPEFHWTDEHYGNITALFAIVYAVGNMFSGRLANRLGTKNGYLLALGVWSVGACMHAFCGWATAKWIGVSSITHLIGNVGEMAVMVASVGLINLISGKLFRYTEVAQTCYVGFQGKAAGYFMVFSYCAVAYLVGWCMLWLFTTRVKRP